MKLPIYSLRTGLIDEALWNTGSNGAETEYRAITTSKFYELERSNNTGKICASGQYCNDPLGRTTAWVGKVGLMYPSDYGYATGGGNYKREYCLSQVLNTWNTECYNDDWLYTSANHQWTLTPIATSSDSNSAFMVSTLGVVNAHTGAAGEWLVRPSVYLKSNVQILSGEGSSTDPFILG